MNDEKRIEELVRKLNQASFEYYYLKTYSMDNLEFDILLKELYQLELKTGYVLPNSPTLNAGSTFKKRYWEGNRNGNNRTN